MNRRLRALIRGTPDAVPGDYVVALVAVICLMLALVVGMFA